MTKWPWLMIMLALVSMVQWPNSIAQQTNDHNSYWEEYLWYPRRYHRQKRTSLDNSENKTPSITSRIMVDQKQVKLIEIEPRRNMKNTNVRTLLAPNVTKSLLKNEYPTNNSSMQIGNDLKLPQAKSSSSIVFPSTVKERIPTVSTNKFIPESQVIDKCSMNGSFCTKVDNYPRQDLLNLFRTSKFMSTNYFGIDPVNDFETRISNTNLQSFCECQEDVIFPEAGVNKNNEWRYIIQDLNENSNFKQGIRVEKCLNAGESCKFSDHLPIGYTTKCIQKYIYKKLVAMKESNEIYYENFKLPSCCACMYSVNSDLLTRKGEETENRRLFQSSSEPLKKNKEVLKTRT